LPNDARLVPNELRTARLVLRRWCEGDAAALEPVLAANFGHLGPWIPKRVAEPASLAVLAERLREFSSAFDAAREWRFGLFAADDDRVLGEVSLFPRDASGRVPFGAAAEIEIGYWLRADETGHGYATEATRATIELASCLPGISHLTIRCDERNAPSAAVPRRLGFRLASTVVEPDSRLQIWRYAPWDALPAQAAEALSS
jgi:RimJ/RimL family protein N-acetyltransferase